MELLGLPTNPTTVFGVHGVTGSAMPPAVQVDSLRADNIELRGVSLPVLTEHVFAGADGILGVEGRQADRIVVDCRRDRVVIGPSSQSRARRSLLTAAVRLEEDGLLMATGRLGRVLVRVEAV